MLIFGCANNEQFFQETRITAETLKQLEKCVEDAGQLPTLDLSEIRMSSEVLKIEDFDN